MKDNTITYQELHDLNEEIIRLEGKPLTGFYAGCNSFENSGKNKWEPRGTSSSMHDCDTCKGLVVDNCKYKKTTPIWRNDSK